MLARHFYALLAGAVIASAAILGAVTLADADREGRSAIVQYKESLLYERGGRTFEAQGIMQIKLYVASGGIGPVYNGSGVGVSNQWLEAIPINVHGGDYVSALPTYPYGEATQRTMLLYAACDLPHGERGGDVAALKAFIKLIVDLDRVCLVPPSSWPILIHFKDRADPHTAERLFPPDLESRYGVILRSVFVERTDAPPTRGIEALLPWVLDEKQTFGMPIATVEEHPRSRPIVLSQEDFRWPSPIRLARQMLHN